MEREGYREALELIQMKYPDEILLSVRQTADFLHLEMHTIYKLIKKGKIKATAISDKTKRIAVTNLANYMCGGH